MKKVRVSRDLFSQPNTPERWGPPFRATCTGLWPIIRQTRTHVMEKHVCVRPNQLEALFWLICQPMGHKRRLVTGGATSGVEHLFTPQNRRVIDITAGRDSQVAAIECHEVETFSINLEASFITVTVRRCTAIWLGFSAFAPCSREQGG